MLLYCCRVITTQQQLDEVLSNELERKLRFTRQLYYGSGAKAAKYLARHIKTLLVQFIKLDIQ